MATIDISKPHTLPLEDARKRAEDLAKGMEAKLGLQWKWEGDSIHFSAPSGVAKGTTGTVSVSASDIRVAVDLPFMLRVMKGTVEEKIKEKLSSLT
jgi:putative polyhydroxyalkanoate system protein